MIDRDEGRYWSPIRYENPAESLLRLRSLEAQGIYTFAGAGSDYDAFKPHNPGTNTIFEFPLVYATPSVNLALFFALVVNNPIIKNDSTKKTVTCEHKLRDTKRELAIYVGADQETIDIVNVPDNSAWVAAFLSSQLRAVQDYSLKGREGEYASPRPRVPMELIKVKNEDFPFSLGEIPLYAPPSDWTSEQKRHHTPFITKGFPCFNRKNQPFDIVSPAARRGL